MILLIIVPNERFWLRNENRSKCLKVEGDRAFGEDCLSTPTLDMLWILRGTNMTQLMNIKTLKCLTRNSGKRSVFMSFCQGLVPNVQSIMCTSDQSKFIKWTTDSYGYLNLGGRNKTFVARSRGKGHHWTSNGTQQLLCGSKKDYKGTRQFFSPFVVLYWHITAAATEAVPT